ncbi:MAG: diguanylate cyclase, partial [Coriobacteriales bacterium]|nr:diguanylate cyclase [Coriobacteriales bacterium]
GDEFVAFCLVDDEGESQALVGSVEAGLARANASKDNEAMPYELALSVGTTCFAITDDPETEFARALMQADERMYAIKQQHRKKKGYRGRES